KNWSTQVQFQSSSGNIVWDFENETLPITFNQWVEIRVEIDLDNDQQEFFYGGTLLGTRLWTDNSFAGGPGVLEIRALDLFANGATAAYYDDVSLEQVVACPWDCATPADGVVSTADLLQLLGDWGDPSPCDFDGSGTVSTSDLLKLLGQWGACP
ncbi:MAG TPA: hypothetical protein VLA09_02200, partial [Longimicrobiales bacterium]|nr:hypothetical protein [Longimicrobiales bacterium]